MARAVHTQIDSRIIRKEPGLVDVQLSIRNRLIDVDRVVTLPCIGADVGNTESRVPVLMLDRKVVLHRIRDLQFFADSLWNSDGRRSGDSGSRKNSRKNHR